MNLYIDVDGVLLGRTVPDRPAVVIASHTREFLSFALSRFDCYWLTTHCQGDSRGVLTYLRKYVDPGLEGLMSGIRPTRFDVMKTEALAGDFVWLDDAPLGCELAWLRDRGLLDRWIDVDTRRRPDDLLRAMEVLTRRLAGRPAPAPGRLTEIGGDGSRPGW
jgi:hypothetical protein